MEEINLEYLGKQRKSIKTGDVFVFKPKNRPYYYGIVANSDANMFGVSGLKHIHLFNICSEKSHIIPDDLHSCKLLIPPILTNQLAWTKGFFKTIGNIPTDNFLSIQKATFFYFNGKIFDDSSNLSEPKTIEETGLFAITSYLNIDNLISLALGIPLAVAPPDNWNPYLYREKIKAMI